MSYRGRVYPAFPTKKPELTETSKGVIMTFWANTKPDGVIYLYVEDTCKGTFVSWNQIFEYLSTNSCDDITIWKVKVFTP